MILITLAMLVSVYFFLTLLALWWVVSTLRLRFNQELRRHRETLLKEIGVELMAQANRLEIHLRKQ